MIEQNDRLISDNHGVYGGIVSSDLSQRQTQTDMWPLLERQNTTVKTTQT